jgi:hypothetical protein
LSAQFEESFSDGNLSANPQWQGDITHFSINEDFVLQLNAPEAGNSQIVTTSQFNREMLWSFWFHLDFNPSPANKFRVYLQADSSDLLNASGYFLEIGESGNEDAIQFYRQDKGKAILLSKARLAAVAHNPFVRIRMSRNQVGLWTLYADYAGGMQYDLEFSLLEDTYFDESIYYFGFYCQYTATRTQDFLLDDISLQYQAKDNNPPALVSIKSKNANKLELTFDEAIEKESAINKMNYLVDKEIGHPISVNPTAANQVVLNFEKDFINQESYTLTLHQLSDLLGNILINFDTVFTFQKIEKAAPFDIIINEIMEKPTISGGMTLGLPNEEYVELYNRSDKIIDLEGIIFSKGAANFILLPSYLLLPERYVILAKPKARDLASFGDFLGLTDFPTLNATEKLTLKDEFGVVLDAVHYTPKWYGSSKREGASLERINPQFPCDGAQNWVASSFLLGGTPGKKNDVFNKNPPKEAFYLTDVYPVAANRIRLTFNKKIDDTGINTFEDIAITNNEIITINFDEENSSQFYIGLATPLIENKIEYLELSASFSDCIGDLISAPLRFPIALPVKAAPKDILINEILFNPATGGNDFLEIYNHSQSIIDISSLYISNRKLPNTTNIAIEKERLIFPNEYIALTASPADIQNRYNLEDSKQLVAQQLPSFPDKQGNISLYITEGLEPVFIDEFDYSSDMHSPLLNDENGVALERINVDLPTQSVGNWHSAAEAVGFGTPGYQNSQAVIISVVEDKIFSLPNKRISPDGDGFEDVLQINYITEKAGYSATIHIYDATGNLIQKIAQNELLGTKGAFKWEGLDANGQPVRIGLYVLWIEYFNIAGEVIREKETIIVAGKF